MESDPNADSLRTVRALRFALMAVILGVSYPNIRLALAIGACSQVYRDMLGNRPIAVEATFTIHARLVFIALSFAIPLVAIASQFIRSLSKSIYLVGVLILLVFLQFYWTFHAMSGPFLNIVQGMQSPIPGP
jgi:hypothetical protein